MQKQYLDYLIDACFPGVNKFLFLSFNNNVVRIGHRHPEDIFFQKQGFYNPFGAWMTMFSTNPYFIIIQHFECYTTPIVKELLCNKNQIFYFYFKKLT